MVNKEKECNLKILPRGSIGELKSMTKRKKELKSKKKKKGFTKKKKINKNINQK